MENRTPEFDYQEVILLASSSAPPASGSPHSSSDTRVYTYDIPKERFHMMLQRLRQKGMRCFQQDIIETYYQTLQRQQFVEQGKVTETKTFDITPLECSRPCAKGFLTVSFKKRKVPDILFPSMLTYHLQKYLRRYVFRINNRLFINLQIENNVQHKIYINFNNSKDVDIEKVLNHISELKDILVPTS
jgi:hypothetical protein